MNTKKTIPVKKPRTPAELMRLQPTQKKNVAVKPKATQDDDRSYTEQESAGPQLGKTDPNNREEEFPHPWIPAEPNNF